MSILRNNTPYTHDPPCVSGWFYKFILYIIILFTIFLFISSFHFHHSPPVTSLFRRNYSTLKSFLDFLHYFTQSQANFFLLKSLSFFDNGFGSTLDLLVSSPVTRTLTYWLTTHHSLLTSLPSPPVLRIPEHVGSFLKWH